MSDSDFTLTSPMLLAGSLGDPILALTIMGHPDPARIGEQYLDASGTGVLEVGRFSPMFCHVGKDGFPLDYGGVSRLPLRLVRRDGGRLQVLLPETRMVVELNGKEIVEPVWLEPERLAAGAVLGLGRAILLCIHFAHRLPRDQPVAGWLGVGSAAVRTRELIRAAALSAAPVLLLGETGTGKEVAARAIHALGRRADAALVAVNMATLSESLAAVELFGAAKGAYTGALTARNGLFAEADGGTLFLDEIGNTPVPVQPMLLRVLESGEYRAVGGQGDRRSSARLITATDQDLYGTDFNQALLRRLEGFVIPMPPLRERREDIGVLIGYLQAQDELAHGPAPALPFALLSALANFDWPGNVRQLAHVLGRALQALRMGESPSLATLVPERGGLAADQSVPGDAEPGRVARQPIGPAEVLSALDSEGWQIQGAARALGISRPTMYKLISLHPEIRRPERIDAVELQAALAAGGGSIERCAALLKTPAEALRRHLHSLGMVG